MIQQTSESTDSDVYYSIATSCVLLHKMPSAGVGKT
jgi:hypothetical protein